MTSENPIRVLHTIGSLELGGAQAFIMNIYRKIDRNKVQFDFVCDHADMMDHAAEIERLGGRVYVFEPFKGFNAGAYRRQWDELLAEHPEYHVVHGHARGAAALYLKAAKDAGRKTVMHSHSTSEGTSLKRFFAKANQRCVNGFSDYKMACSIDAARWYFGSKAVDNGQVRIIKNAIDASDYACDGDEGLHSDDSPVIVNVGRLVTQKNQTFILEVFSELLNLRPDCKLRIVGDGPLRDELRALANELCPIGSVEFLGARPDVSDILKRSDAFIMTSINEGLGIALVEAQAAGLPCVISDVVPEEADVVPDRVKRLSLDDPVKTWAQALLDSLRIEKRNTYDEIVRAGYDSAANARFFEDFYTSLNQARSN